MTTLLTGALILYVSYFEWSEFPAVPTREAAASFMPPAVAAVQDLPAAAGAVADPDVAAY
jgi:hypothetical protein